MPVGVQARVVAMQLWSMLHTRGGGQPGYCYSMLKA